MTSRQLPIGKSSAKTPVLRLRSTTLAIAYMLGLTPGWAANLSVNNLIDTTTSGDGVCTLREAIANANTNSDASGGDCAAGTGVDNITFSVDGIIVLGSTLSITDPVGLTIDGAGRRVTLSGNNAVRVMQVSPGTKLTLKDLTVANGFHPSMGGGIANEDGFLGIVNCTISGNSTSQRGGGIAHYSNVSTPSGYLAVVNSTLSGNSAFFGGAIWDGHGGPITLTNSTIAYNSAITPICTSICAQIVSQGGGIDNSVMGATLQAGTLNLHNSIVAGNTYVIKRANLPDIAAPSDINGFVTGGSANLIGSQDGFYTGIQNGVNGNRIGFDVTTILAPTLANNGGATQTLALINGSPAIDTALAASCPATDQRGVARPQGNGCDIGAFEVAVMPTMADLAISGTVTPNPVMVRDRYTVTLGVTNNGPLNATGVTVTDTLPLKSSSVSASTSQGSCGALSNGKVTCNLGNLAAGASATVTLKGIVGTSGTLNNQATVSGVQSDSQPSNNLATQTVTAIALSCNGKTPTIVGTPGNDNLRGTSRADVIQGLGGNDTISGSGGNDTLCGGEGTDYCDGGSGTDTAANCEGSVSVP